MKYRKIIIIVIPILLLLGALSYNFWFAKSQAVSRSGLVGYWTLDQNDIRYAGTATTTYDKSGLNNTGTFSIGANTYGATSTPGKIRQAIDFDGVDDYVSVANESNFDFTTNFSISLWMKAKTDSKIYEGVIAKGAGGTGWDLILTNGALRMGVRGSSQIDTSGGLQDVRDNQWHYVTVVATNSNVKIYLDSVQYDSDDGTWTATTNNNPVFIGQRNDFLGAFNGVLDDVRIYNYALSAQEVANLYSAAKVNYVQAPSRASSTVGSLVGYWTMDANDINGTNYYDKSGFNNTATSNGSPTIATGKMKQAVGLNGSTQWLSANDSNSLDVNSFTASVWMKGSVISGQNVFVAKWGITGQSSFLFDLNSGLPRLILSQDGTANASINTATNALVAGQWYQVAVVYNSSAQSVVFYVNGSVAPSSLTSGAVPASLKQGTDVLNIGSSLVTGTGFFNGSLDDVRIYNYALSAQEVANLYSAAKVNYISAPTRTGLVGWWTLDQNDIRYAGTATTTYDKSGFNNTGTFSIGANTYGATSTPGKIRQGISFDGVDDYVSVPHSASISPANAITVSAWIKVRTSSGNKFYIDKGSNDNGYHIYDDGVSLAFFLAGDGASISIGSRCIDVWCHIVGTWDGAAEKIYRDGVFKNQQARASAITYSNDTLYIGSNDGSSFIDADFDDVRIYNYALSAAEVAQLYSSAKVNYIK